MAKPVRREHATNKDKLPKVATHWTTRTLAAKLITNHMFVARVWNDCGFKPHRHQEFLSFLKMVEAQIPSHKELHVIVDNYSTHKHTKVRQLLYDYTIRFSTLDPDTLNGFVVPLPQAQFAHFPMHNEY